MRAIRIVFTHDNAFLVAGAFPPKAETDKAKKERKRPDEMPRNSMIVVNLATLGATRVADVASFQVPELGESFAAYLHGPKPPRGRRPHRKIRIRRAALAATRRAAGRAKVWIGPGAPRFAIGQERTFEDVLEYSIAKDSKTLLYTVGSKNEETNGAYAVVPGSDAAPAALLTGKGQYTKLTWDLAGHRVAFLSDRDDQSSKPAKFKAYLWERSGVPAEIISTATAGSKPATGSWIAVR